MTKHEAIARVVHALRAAGLATYKRSTARAESVPGVSVTLIDRRGVLGLCIYGLSGAAGAAALASAREALAALGCREIYVNEPGLAVRFGIPTA